MGTYEENRAEYCAAMGEELGTQYHLLWNECALLHMRWEEYLSLFGKSEEEFALMNATAPNFFRFVQDISWEHTLLSLCRFADPAKVSSRRTLSLDGLLQIERTRSVPRLPELVTSAREKMTFARDWRNRRIAHRDLEHALNANAKPLSPASRDHVCEALAGIHAVLEAISMHFTNASLMFRGASHAGGENVLRELRLARRLRQERRSRFDLGSPLPDDLNYEMWH